MISQRPALLMTRPAEASERFVKALRAEVVPGPIVVSPIFEIVPMPAEIDLTKFGGVIFSSSQAVALIGMQVGMPAYCIGHRTTEVARQYGFEARFSGADADALVENLKDQRPEGKLIHLRGTHSRGAISQRLSSQGINAEEAVLYDQVSRQLNPDALTMLDGERPVILPLFSPRSAKLLSRKIQGNAPRWVVCMSEAVAQNAKGLGAMQEKIVNNPQSAAMCAAVAGLYRDTPPVEGRNGNA